MRNIIALGLLLVAANSTAYAQSSHRIIGTWEQDPERTVFDDSASEPLRAIHKYEEGENGVHRVDDSACWSKWRTGV